MREHALATREQTVSRRIRGLAALRDDGLVHVRDRRDARQRARAFRVDLADAPQVDDGPDADLLDEKVHVFFGQRLQVVRTD